MNSPNAYKSSLVGGLFAALGATACCFGPLLLVTLGLGGAWVSSLRMLEPYQPLFLLLTLACIGFAFHRLYLKPRQCDAGKVCAVPAVLKRQRIIFWLVVVIIAALFSFPLYAPLFY
jgi:mercuric ion transport protein